MGKKTWLSIHPINFSSDKMVHTYVRSSTLHVGEILHFKHAPISAVNRMATRVIREKITTTKQQSGVFFIAAVRKWEILAATEVKVNGSKKKKKKKKKASRNTCDISSIKCVARKCHVVGEQNGEENLAFKLQRTAKEYAAKRRIYKRPDQQKHTLSRRIQCVY